MGLKRLEDSLGGLVGYGRVGVQTSWCFAFYVMRVFVCVC